MDVVWTLLVVWWAFIYFVVLVNILSLYLPHPTRINMPVYVILIILFSMNGGRGLHYLPTLYPATAARNVKPSLAPLLVDYRQRLLYAAYVRVDVARALRATFACARNNVRFIAAARRAVTPRTRAARGAFDAVQPVS